MQVKTMNEDKISVLREHLSALADGELGMDDVARLVQQPAAHEEVQATWHAYHLIGDVLRGGEQAVPAGSSGFLSRLQTRLDAEAPLVPARPLLPEQPLVVAMSPMAEPANDANFRWKMVAGCASFAAVVAMAWSVAGGGVSTAVQPQLAVLSPAAPALVVAPQTVEQPVTLANGEPQVMIRDARLDELLTAHRQAGGGAALQMPAGFLRSATFATPER